MCNKISATAGDFRCDVGKKKLLSDGHFAVNLFTNFEPLGHPLFLLSLRDSPHVARVANTAYYGHGFGGGITIYLAADVSEVDLCVSIQEILLRVIQDQI